MQTSVAKNISNRVPGRGYGCVTALLLFALVVCGGFALAYSKGSHARAELGPGAASTLSASHSS